MDFNYIFTSHKNFHIYNYNYTLHTSSPLQQRKSKEMAFSRIILLTALVLMVKAEIKPHINSMWTQTTINDCYSGQVEETKGHVRLLLKMTLEKPYIFASYCECLPSESEQIGLWQNFTVHLLPSLAILDESVKMLLEKFHKMEQLLEQNPLALRQSRINHH